MFFNKIICESLKSCRIGEDGTSHAQHASTTKTDSSNKRIEILKEVTSIESSNIRSYVVGMQTIHKKVRYIDTSREHYE